MHIETKTEHEHSRKYSTINREFILSIYLARKIDLNSRF